jgi:methyltransferase
VSAPHLVLLLVVLQRLAELALAQRNTIRLRQQGAVEIGAGHYPLFILLHGSWLLAIAVLIAPDTRIDWPLLILYALLQFGRAWVLVSLGRFWTTRILSLADAPLVRRGPYRFLRHPNYLVVALEIPLLPLVFHMLSVALPFGIANLALLAYRIRIEEAALAARRAA